jgi:drug/metabolite transporter (DMT)-like permease
MSVPVAYATILVIWSTTPLGILWSSETLTPITAITFRMMLAAIAGYAILRALNIALPWNIAALKVYSASLLGIYAAMLCTYMAASYVPSGIITVIYALSPVVSSLLSYFLIGNERLSKIHLLAFFISFMGLLSIFVDDWVVKDDGWIGLVLLLLAVCLYSLSGVLVEKQKYHAHPLSITVGTLLLSIPLFVLSWIVMDGEIPEVDWSSRSPWAVIYLALAGSLLGFACYFFIIKELGATAVATVTLSTPVFALALGSILNGESISLDMLIGTVFILIGLVLCFISKNQKPNRIIGKGQLSSDN